MILLCMAQHTAHSRGWTGRFPASQYVETVIETSIGKSFCFPTRLLTLSGSTIQKSTVRAVQRRDHVIRALVNDVGHDLIARSARDAGALLARASSAARQRGQEDVRGSNRRVRIETHHPCQDLVDGSLLASMRIARTWARQQSACASAAECSR